MPVYKNIVGGDRGVFGFLGFFLALFGAGEVQHLNAVGWEKWLDPALVQVLNEPRSAPDPAAVAAVRSHLQSVGSPASENGIWIQASDEILAENEGSTALPAASLTKIATTIAALSTWGHEYQFETIVGATGTIENGVLQGDLVIQGGGDPLFVWEEAIALGNALNELGITRITGNLVIAGKFFMNFQGDPTTSGNLLRQGINADLWNAEAATQYQQLPSSTAQPRVVIDGSVQVIPIAQAQSEISTPLIRHRSLPLLQILKAMNIYSNNFIADAVANDLGGAAIVSQKAAEAANVPVEEIRLINGSGLGEDNRISPRAVAAMLIATQGYLLSHDLNVADIFPVSGRERGTLGDRAIPTGSAVKTGTLDAVSSLAGVVATRDRGLVWFAIINLGTADLKFLHNQQDALLQDLTQAWGSAPSLPTALTPDYQPEAYRTQLGDPSRNERL